MENIREVISKNLISLRKQNKLTQIELGKKINYSDKAVSRWEKGEVLPDIEILQTISNIYDVPLTYFFTEHLTKEEQSKKTKNEIIMQVFLICIFWTFFTMVYVYLNFNYHLNFWQAFVWPVPLSFITIRLLVRNRKSVKWWHKCLLDSFFLWTLIAAVYLQLLSYNAWILFIIGVPIQVTLIAGSYAQALSIKED